MIDLDVEERTITIRALTVNGKKFSQALFRQLPVGETFVDDIGLIDKPWGRVSMGDGRSGEWVVYEKGGQLFKAKLIYGGAGEYDWDDAWLESELGRRTSRKCLKPNDVIDERRKLEELREAMVRNQKSAEKIRALPQLFIGI